MLASVRKRQASPPEQAMNAKRRAQELVTKRLQARARSPEDHHQIRVQSCCNCAKIFSTPHTLLSCTECDHTICTRCPVDDPLLLFPHPGLIQQRYEDMNKEAGDRSLGMGLSMFRRGQENELGHDSEEEDHQQELQLQSQPQPTEKQRQVETGVQSKRSLNMNKCERCRLDKKKCLPVDRVWPTKCDLCTKKGFSCSESKRVIRSTKRAPATTLSPMNTTSPSANSVSFEERLKQWTFLLNYRKMMLAAKDRLEQLRRDISSPPVENPLHLFYRSKYRQFCEFVKDELPDIMYECSEELLCLDPSSHNLPGWFLITSLNQTDCGAENNFACPECRERPRSRDSGLESSQDTCGELLLLQHRVMCHNLGVDDELWQVHAHLSHEVQKQASEIFKSYKIHEGAKWANSFGVYHPDVLECYIPGSTEVLYDCLERTRLHLRMDNADYYGPEFDPGLDVSKLKDNQDILGRTPLLIACQETWEEAVVRLLEENADPGLSTMYGSLPLHYAAAKGSIDICQLLLSHKTRFDIKAKDCVGKTALDYARENEHQDVINLLSAEYAAADQALEELERARSLQAGLENHEVQGSYFV